MTPRRAAGNTPTSSPASLIGAHILLRHVAGEASMSDGAWRGRNAQACAPYQYAQRKRLDRIVGIAGLWCSMLALVVVTTRARHYYEIA
jgi:hypothetical protein